MYPNASQLREAIDARPAAKRALAIQERYAFNEDLDDEAKRALSSQNA